MSIKMGKDRKLLRIHISPVGTFDRQYKGPINWLIEGTLKVGYGTCTEWATVETMAEDHGASA